MKQWYIKDAAGNKLPLHSDGNGHWYALKPDGTRKPMAFYSEARYNVSEFNTEKPDEWEWAGVSYE